MPLEAPLFIIVEEIDEAETRHIFKIATHPAAGVTIGIAQPEGLGVVDEHLVGQRLDDRVPPFFGPAALARDTSVRIEMEFSNLPVSSNRGRIVVSTVMQRSSFVRSRCVPFQIRPVFHHVPRMLSNSPSPRVQ
jgi:hypothetical protein